MQSGISTHLYHDWRLTRAHLGEIAAAGFEAIELFATRTHFDYHDAAAIASLRSWLAATGLRLHSVHAPIAASLAGGRWSRPFSNATADSARREEAVREAAAALAIAEQIPYGFLVLHLGLPAEQAPGPEENRRDAARRSLEQLHALAEPCGVRIAIEVIPNDLSRATALVELLEEELDLPGAGICLDFGHAFLMGDVIDAVETVSGHLLTTHVHDNHGRLDDHRVPFEGGIDWPSVLMATRKIGYDGTYLFEVANDEAPSAVLARTARARQRMQGLMHS